MGEWHLLQRFYTRCRVGYDCRDDAHGCASVTRGHECMDARVRATQGAVAEEPEVTAGARVMHGAITEARLFAP